MAASSRPKMAIIRLHQRKQHQSASISGWRSGIEIAGMAEGKHGAASQHGVIKAKWLVKRKA